MSKQTDAELLKENEKLISEILGAVKRAAIIIRHEKIRALSNKS